MTAIKPKDEPPRKLKAARKIINEDRRNCIERLSLFWHLDCYTPREIYRAMLGIGWVRCERDLGGSCGCFTNTFTAALLGNAAPKLKARVSHASN